VTDRCDIEKVAGWPVKKLFLREAFVTRETIDVLQNSLSTLSQCERNLFANCAMKESHLSWVPSALEGNHKAERVTFVVLESNRSTNFGHVISGMNPGFVSTIRVNRSREEWPERITQKN
jgi:hypothetical protein